MRTESQREASRKNGAKSQGPKTSEGKAISSLNAIRRGLLSKTLLIEDESSAHFAALLQQLFDEFQPLPGNETTLVESMAIARWRQLRLLGMESAAISHEIRNHRGMSKEPLTSLTHAVFATRNLTDRSRVLSYLSRELRGSELHYTHAHRALMKSLSQRAIKFHQIEPGVPLPEPCKSVVNKEPPV
jgi:hypothetical protein